LIEADHPVDGLGVVEHRVLRSVAVAHFARERMIERLHGIAHRRDLIRIQVEHIHRCCRLVRDAALAIEAGSSMCFAMSSATLVGVPGASIVSGDAARYFTAS
jgi:hypothetical protein